jgi:hypothetical protein
MWNAVPGCLRGADSMTPGPRSRLVRPGQEPELHARFRDLFGLLPGLATLVSTTAARCLAAKWSRESPPRTPSPKWKRSTRRAAGEHLAVSFRFAASAT